MKEVKKSKIILAIICSLPILIISQTLAEFIASGLYLIKIPAFVCNIIAAILYSVFAFIIIKLFSSKVIKCELRDILITKFELKTKWIIIAFLLPVSVSVIYLFLDGNIQKSDMNVMQILEVVSAGIFHTGLAAGIVEEMIFRGLVMNVIMQKWGRKAAIIIPSLLFGIIHIIGRDFTLLSYLQVIVAGTAVGVMFSLIALESHSIWNSALVHAVWNAVIIGGIFSISEKYDGGSIFSYILSAQNFAITGGEFGIESSIISIIGYCIVIIIAYIGLKKN